MMRMNDGGVGRKKKKQQKKPSSIDELQLRKRQLRHESEKWRQQLNHSESSLRRNEKRSVRRLLNRRLLNLISSLVRETPTKARQRKIYRIPAWLVWQAPFLI